MPSAVSQPAPDRRNGVPGSSHHVSGPRGLPIALICGRFCEPLLVAVAAAAVFATRFRYLPQTLGDLDSVNFHLGVHQFSPFEHQPHPPGYAVFIGLAKLVHPWFATHAAGLAFPSVLFSALAVFPLYWMSRRLVGRTTAALATTLVIFNPVLWLNSVRPMSDLTGFALTVTAQCLLVHALVAESASRDEKRSLLSWSLGVIVTGLAVGTRLQAVVLAGPLLLRGVLKRRAFRWPAIALFPATCALWVVPTITASGGMRRFSARLGQMLADVAPVEPLITQLTWQRARIGMIDAFATPWGNSWLAGIILLAAAVGVVVLWRQHKRNLGLLLLLFGPYAIYHLLLQTTDLRYAIPILPIVALLAAATFVRVAGGRPVGALAASATFLFVSTAITRPALEAYAGAPTPPASAVQYLRELAATERNPVVAGHYVFDRYLTELIPAARVIRTKPMQEWRALNRFWVTGDRRPVWFLRDPERIMEQRLADSETQTLVAAWQWPEPVVRLLKGARPTKVELVRLDPPRWFAESGFYLTPEAGFADVVAREPHVLFVRSDSPPHDVIVSGTALSPTAVTAIVGKEAQRQWRVSRYFSLRVAAPDGPATGSYVPVRFEAGAPLLLTDVSFVADGRDRVRPLAGFSAPERDELDREFLWMGPRGEAVLSRSGAPLRVTLRGSAPLEYFRRALTLKVHADGSPAREHHIDGEDFVVELELPAAEPHSETVVTLSASESFVPDEIEHNGDRRALAIRVYELRTESVSPAPGSGPDRTVP